MQSAKHLKRKAQAELGPRGMADGVGMDGMTSDYGPMKAERTVANGAMAAEADGPRLVMMLMSLGLVQNGWMLNKVVLEFQILKLQTNCN